MITGVSGSGKSTLAFDILFNEGQRRYLESLNAYARQFVQPAARPDVDAIFGIPPTVAIEQRTSRGGRKSTVATLTEIYHFLRLLYVKLGTQYCPDCDVAIEPQSAARSPRGCCATTAAGRITLLAPLVVARKGYYTDLAKWAAKKGFETLRVDGGRLADRALAAPVALPRAHDRAAGGGARGGREDRRRAACGARARARLRQGRGARAAGRSRRPSRCFPPSAPAPPAAAASPSSTRACSPSTRSHGWCESCYGTGVEMPGFDEEQTGEELWWNEWYDREPPACGACRGERLNPVALNVRFRGRSIAALSAQSVAASGEFFARLRLKPRERQIARDLLAEIRARLRFLARVGLGYLELDRSAPTLSGGEAQRIRLAAQLGSNLQGVCYVLDEPTIGLHPRDNAYPARLARRASPATATLWSSSSTTRTRSGAPTTCST